MITSEQLDQIGYKLYLARHYEESDKDYAERIRQTIYRRQPAGTALNGIGITLEIMLNSIKSDFMQELEAL